MIYSSLSRQESRTAFLFVFSHGTAFVLAKNILRERDMLQHSEEYRHIANRLIETLPEFRDIREAKPKIAYLVSDEEKKQNRKIIFGDCNLVSSRYKWCCPYDFFIVVYEPNIEAYGFGDKQKETLMRHELHHVGIDFEGVENKYYIVPHDVEEFWHIIDDCGLRWCEMDAERREPEQ